jgi:hypothetical protein
MFLNYFQFTFFYLCKKLGQILTTLEITTFFCIIYHAFMPMVHHNLFPFNKFSIKNIIFNKNIHKYIDLYLQMSN